MSTRGNVRRPTRGRPTLIGAIVAIAVGLVAALVFGAASGRFDARHASGDHSAARTALRSSEQRSSASGHASLVSRSSSASSSVARAAGRTPASAQPAFFPAFDTTFAGIGRTLAASSGCGASGTLADATGFEDADGNLAVDKAGCTDWNSFSPSWSGGVGTATLGGLTFYGLTDPVSSNSDNIYAGGVKQDTVCPAVTTGSADNKADLSRIYIATETLNGHVYLFLAWERAPQNTIESDVLVSFEFNQGKVACANGDGFVQRTKGDLLLVYNFHSGNSTIEAYEWDGTTWQALTTPPFEASVNTNALPNGDTIGPNGPVSLGKYEFGEAGVDLSALSLSGNGGRACETFGMVYGESRTSQSGPTAQMKDYAGPAPVDVSNCVTPTISTQTSVSSMNLGDTVTAGDSATLTGNNPTGSVSFQLYSDASCQNPVAGVSGSAPLDSSGRATFSGVSFTPTQPGTYYWGVSYAGDGNNNPASACGGLNEEIVVNAPSLSVKKTADRASVDAGDPVGFTITVSNGGPGTAKGVSLSDPLPSGTASSWSIDSQTTAGQCSISSGTLSCSPVDLASGASFSVHVTAQTSYAACTTYDNTATASASNAPDAQDSASVTCEKPSLSVKKTADRASVDAGDPVGFTVTVSNGGPGTAKGVSLSDPLPAGSGAGLTWKIDSGPTGSVTPTCQISGSAGSQTLTCSAVDLAAGDHYSVHVTAQTSLAECSQYDNTATASASNAPDAKDSASITCASPSLSVTKTADHASVNAGDPIGFTITVSNGGPGTAYHVGLTDPLPSGTASPWAIDSQTTAGQCSISGGNLSCSPVDLASGASFSVHISATTDLANCTTYQNTATASSTNAGSPSGSATIVCQTPSPTISTTQDPASGAIGSTYKDKATLSGAVNLDGSGSITFTLYSAKDCGGSVVDTETVKNIGANGTVETPTGVVLQNAGDYYWVASFSGDSNNPAVTSGCNDEKVTVAQNQPTISTTQDPASGAIGSTYNDQATLSGGASYDGSGSVTFTLYPQADCQGTPLDTETVKNISANGTVETPTGVVLQNAGDYYWVASFSGDSNNGPATSGCNDEKVTVAPNQPTIATTQDPASGVIGSTFKDSATLSQTANLDGSGSITFTLYPQADCQGTPLDSETVKNIGSNGPVETPTGVVLQRAGDYYWVASFSGDSNNLPATSGCNDEKVTVAPSGPSITTQLSASAGNVGLSVHDTAKLAGATADAGGTVTYTVYSDSACTSKVADAGTVTVTNGAVPDSNAITFNTPGMYYWQASYSGDANNKPATSACTDEKLVVAPLIDLAVTKAGSPNPDRLPGDITWTMVVTNNGPDTATGVKVSDPMPSGNAFVSASTTQGACTGGAILSCSLGTLAAGGKVTITLVTRPSTVGTQTNTVTVVGNETETNTANNTASASVVVEAPVTPPVVYCVAVSKIKPTQLYVGRKTRLTIHVTQHGKAVRGVRVRITGPKIDVRTKPSNRKGVIERTVRMKKAGIVVFTPIASKRCNTKRVGVTGIFTPPVTG